MIDLFVISSFTVAGMIGGVNCEFFQTVGKSTLTERGASCVREWEDYRKANDALCSGNVCNALYIAPPTCDTVKVPSWKREIGFCEDGTMRWREAK